jgi:hypothetical protein
MSGLMSWSVGGFLERKMKILKRELERAGQNITTDAKTRMQTTPRTGKEYLSRSAGKGRKGGDYFVKDGHRWRKGVRRRASVTGNAPAPDTGELKNHVGYAVRQAGMLAPYMVCHVGIISARGGTDELRRRALALELGIDSKGRQGGWLGARPSFGPALTAEQRAFVPRLMAALRDGK